MESMFGALAGLVSTSWQVCSQSIAKTSAGCLGAWGMRKCELGEEAGHPPDEE